MDPTTSSDTFNLIDTLHHLMQNWWKITLCVIIFGLLGLAFSFIRPPKYEAQAIFSSTIDYRNQPYELTQYDLDLALSVVQRILLQVRNQAIAYAQTLDPTLDSGTFEQNMRLERLHDRWYLRYRHQNPLIAQSIVNHWAELGAAQLAEEQASGKVESFVLASLIAEANLPNRPIYQNRNTMVLAGSLIGFGVGIILVDIKYRYFSSAPKGD
jgi:uncharacterized protein involved in exopolysaccharide biosynthesis